MADVAHTFGEDTSWDATGDLAVSVGPQLTQERLLRRLLTSPTDYIEHLDYGAGLGALVGDPVHPMTVRALVQEQVVLETSVASSPAPSATVQANATGTVLLTVSYADADGTPQALTLNLGTPKA